MKFMSDAVITSLVVLGIFVSLIKDWFSPAISFLLGLTIVTATGVINEEQALEGFKSPTLIIIGSLLVLSAAAQRAFNTQAVTERLMGGASSERKALARLMAGVMVSSAFVANTPVVAMLINPIIEWAQAHKISPSKFLIPLSYASIFGGVLTLIGTSTNLIASGFLESSGYGSFSFFEFLPVSGPMTIISFFLMIWLAPKLLPNRNLAKYDNIDIARKFTVDSRIKPSLHGKTVEEAGLRNLKDVFLTSILRENGDEIAPVKPDTKLLKNDILRFSGGVTSLGSLDKICKHLSPVEQKHVDNVTSSSYFEIIIGQNRSIVGKSLKELSFRSRYNAAVLGIIRSGKRVTSSLGQTVLQPGDNLLVVADENFIETWQDRNDFLLIRELGHHKSLQKHLNKTMYVIVGVILALLALGVDFAFALLAGALLSVIFKVQTTNRAKTEIDIELLLMIASAVGVAKAVEVSGIATKISAIAADTFGGLGLIGILVGLILLVSLLTELITNNAAVLLVLPVALASANELGVDPRGMFIAVTIMASLSLLTPLGYQTNTMVYSAGGYKFTDFLKIGAILHVITIILVTTLVYFMYYA